MNKPTKRHPQGYCVNCGQPKSQILDLRCHACDTQLQAAYGYYSTANLQDIDDTVSMPAIALADIPQDPPPTLRICDREEITPERAACIYRDIYNTIWNHRSNCETCCRYAMIGMGMGCLDEMSMWVSLRFWSKYLPEATYGTL